MAKKTIYTALREAFPKPAKGMWQRAASKETGGKDPFENLSWKSSDGIKFFPYYDELDVMQPPYLQQLSPQINGDSFYGAKKWLIVPQVTVNKTDEAANKISLEHLAGGADGILYVIAKSPEWRKLLSQVDWPSCSLFFQCSENVFFSKDLREYIHQSKFDPHKLNGALFWESRPKKSEVDFYLQSYKNLKSLGIVIRPSSPAKEIADGLSEAVHRLESLKEFYLLVDLLNAITFAVPVDENFFESIAKTSALRFLWYQVSQAYGVKNTEMSALHIHAISLPWIAESYEPHGNMIKGTTAAMASLLGGADALTMLPQDEYNGTMRRIARNIAVILREESHFNKVVNPVAGAYALDTLIDEIAKKAWELFQINMKNE